MNNIKKNIQNFVCNPNECTGCGACMQLCPKNCISFKKDALDSIIATIDTSKCIQCNLCKKVCPQYRKLYNKPLKCYAAWSSNELERNSSASGGIAAEVYNYCCDNDYYFCGTCFNEKFDLNFKITKERKYIKDFKNSKYVFSHLSSIYMDIFEKLIAKKTVIFVGLPCQVAAVKNYISLRNAPMDNFITIDLICHGITPDDYLKQHISYIEKRYKKQINKIYFRDPSYNTNKFVFSAYNNDKILYHKAVDRNDPYQIGYHYGITYRENCYSCKFACIERTGDLTLSDFSSVGKIEPFEQKSKKITCLFANTDKGIHLIKELVNNNKIIINERPIEEKYNFEKQLHFPTKKTKYRDKFVKRYILTGNFIESMNYSAKSIYIKNELIHLFKIKELRNFCSRLMPNKIKKIIKKIIR